jgi:hypothetical protein
MLEQLQAELAYLAPMLLPPEARALTVEAIATQLTARVYLHGPGSLARWADLDAKLAPLIERRLPEGGGWNVIVQAIRQDRPAALEIFGTVVWVEEGTAIRRRDGRRTGQ